MNLISKGTTNGKCYLMISDSSDRHATVSGSNLTLHVEKHTETTDATCNGKKSEFTKDPVNEVSIRDSAEPRWAAVVPDGKDGEACKTPKER